MKLSPGTSPAQPGTSPALRRRPLCALLLCITVPLGLAWRLAPWPLSPFAFKYGGSALWAVALYWTIALLRPRWRAGLLALSAGLLALAVELFKLVRSPALDAFRTTLAGKLLIGRYFTLGAIAAYWLAIATVALLDLWLDLRLRPGRPS